jgi:AbrB family looped-hinge helix DNA binding protein
MVALNQVLTVTSKGQVVLPGPVRQLLSLEAGNQVLFEFQKDGVRMTRVGLPCHFDIQVKGLITQFRNKGENLDSELVDPYFGYQLLRRKTGELQVVTKSRHISTLSTRGQLTLPQAVRGEWDLVPGSKIVIELRNEHATFKRFDTTMHIDESIKPKLKRIEEEINKGQNITDWGGAIATRMSNSTGKTSDMYVLVVGKVAI